MPENGTAGPNDRRAAKVGPDCNQDLVESQRGHDCKNRDYLKMRIEHVRSAKVSDFGLVYHMHVQRRAELLKQS